MEEARPAGSIPAGLATAVDPAEDPNRPRGVPAPRWRRVTFGLRSRVAAASACLALVLSVTVAALAYNQIRAQLLRDRERSAQNRAFVNARQLRLALAAETSDLSALLDLDSGRATGRSVALARVDGEWFSGSVALGSDAVPRSLIDVVAANDAGQQRVVVDGEPFVVVGIPVVAEQAQYFEFVSLQDIDGALDGLAIRLVVIASATTLLGAFIGWSASRRVLRPLREMSEAAVNIADGSLDRRLSAPGDPDLEPFVISFNQMADAVQERIDREVRFTSNVSHEVRSPVATMLASISLARRRVEDPDAARSSLDDLEERTQAFNSMVTDLLEISRAESGSAELVVDQFEPRRLVEAVLATLDADVPVEVTATAPSAVEGDRRRIGQVLTNLLTNADRYGGGATRIVIDGDGQKLIVALEDAGPGVPEHERAFVFERFARGANATGVPEGTGLGLALVVEHVRLHGGTVRIEDRPGGGARFVVELPVQQPEGSS